MSAIISRVESNRRLFNQFCLPRGKYHQYRRKKLVKQETVIANQLKVVSNQVLQAKYWDQVIALAMACPILNYGGSVEIRDIPKPILVGTLQVALLVIFDL